MPRRIEAVTLEPPPQHRTVTVCHHPHARRISSSTTTSSTSTGTIHRGPDDPDPAAMDHRPRRRHPKWRTRGKPSRDRDHRLRRRRIMRGHRLLLRGAAAAAAIHPFPKVIRSIAIRTVPNIIIMLLLHRMELRLLPLITIIAAVELREILILHRLCNITTTAAVMQTCWNSIEPPCAELREEVEEAEIPWTWSRRHQRNQQHVPTA